MRSLLLESRADANIPGEGNELLLTMAAKTGDSVLCKLLLENGADPRLMNGDGKTAEMIWLSTYSEQPNIFTSYARQICLDSRKVQICSLFSADENIDNTDFNNLRKQINNASFTITDAADLTADDLLRKVIGVWDSERLGTLNYSNRLFSPMAQMPLPPSVQTVKALLELPYNYRNRPTKPNERRVTFAL